MENKLKNKKKMLERFIHLLSKQRFKLVVVVMIVIASIGLKLTTPLAVGKVFDVIFDGIIAPLYDGTKNFHIDFYKLREIILLMLGKVIASSILIYIQKYVMNIIGREFVQSLKEEVSGKLSRSSLTRKKKKILNRISGDCESISRTLQKSFIELIKIAVTIVGTVILMIKINWILASVSLISISLILFATAIISNKRYQQKSMRVIGPMVMKLFQYVVIAGVGLMFMIQGRLSFGQIQAFFQYIKKASHPFTEAKAILHSLQSVLASTERVLDEVEKQKYSKNKYSCNNKSLIMEMQMVPAKIISKGHSLRVNKASKDLLTHSNHIYSFY